MKNIHCPWGKPEPKLIGPNIIVEVKEIGMYIIKDKCSKQMEKLILIDHIMSFSDETLDQVKKEK